MNVIQGETAKLKNKKNQFDQPASSMEAQEFKLVSFYHFSAIPDSQGNPLTLRCRQEGISYESYN